MRVNVNLYGIAHSATRKSTARVQITGANRLREEFERQWFLVGSQTGDRGNGVAWTSFF